MCNKCEISASMSNLEDNFVDAQPNSNVEIGFYQN